jgi:murein hydrolase activator
MLNRCLNLLLLVSLLWGSSVFADDLSRSRQQLEQIRSRIETTETALKSRQQSEQTISRDLALLSGQLEQIDQRIKRIKDQQQQLQQQQRSGQQSLQQSQKQVSDIGKRLEQRLIALYKEGDSGLLKILFSAESPTQLIQQYHYLTRVMETDAELMEEYRQAISISRQQLRQLDALQQQQEQLLEQEQQQRADATAARGLQTRLLRQAQADNKKLQQELTQLREDANQLTALIEKLKRQPPPPPARTGDVLDFAGHRGQLPWPVEGNVSIQFGTQRDTKLGTLYESNGIEISTPPRTDVRAVAQGQVVYADYFKGYGNLVIVSHQGEFHTLYAQLEKLHHKTGAQVATGAIVGVSGLSNRESVYFEIRHKGMPVNPLHWLKSL